MCLLSSLNGGSAQTPVETNQYKSLIKPMSQCKQWTYGISKESTNEVVNMFWILTNLQLNRDCKGSTDPFV